MSVAAVLLLVVLAIRPDFHESVHHHADEEDHSCAVVLFSQGVTPAIDTAFVQAKAERIICIAGTTDTRIAPARPTHLLPPGRGPPV